MPTKHITSPRRDLAGAVLAFGFVVLLLASEAALTLPDETDSAATVSAFSAAHSATSPDRCPAHGGLFGGRRW
jgi:hypothetical protein